MMQRFLFRCKVRTFSANNKEKMLFSSLFIIFLDERDGERFKYRKNVLLPTRKFRSATLNVRSTSLNLHSTSLNVGSTSLNETFI